MSALIDITRATQNSTLNTLASTTAGAAYLSSLISAASTAITRYCFDRDFVGTTYIEYHSGGRYQSGNALPLRHYPVTRIGGVDIANQCLVIQNAGGTVQKATVETLANNSLKLIHTISAVSTTNTLIAATYPTIGQLATAINAIGSGWSATVYSGAAGSYNGFPTTDLKTLQGAVSAMIGGAYLDIYESWYGWGNSAGWDNDCEPGAAYSSWRLDDETGELYGHFPRGTLNLRITYTAGEATVPQTVQEACVIVTQWLYQNSLRDGTIKESRLGPASEVLNDSQSLPAAARILLAPYRYHSKVIYR